MTEDLWEMYNIQHFVSHFDGLGFVDHITIERVDGRDGIPWDHLQAIKNEILGEDAWAIEVYPPEAELVNEVNRRHLWRLPFGTPLPNLKHRGM